MPTTAQIVENLLVVVQNGKTDREQLLAAGRMGRELTATGKPYGVLVYLAAQTKLPDEVDRKAIAAFLRENSPHAGGLAVVVTGTGFFAAAMRGAGTAISRAAGYSMPIYQTTEKALKGLTKDLNGAVPDPETVLQIIAEQSGPLAD